MMIQKILNGKSETNKNPLLNYVRKYAILLDTEKNKIFKKMKVNKDDYYNLEYSDDQLDKIKKYVTKYFNKKN